MSNRFRPRRLSTASHLALKFFSEDSCLRNQPLQTHTLFDLTFTTTPAPEPDRALFSLEICYENIKQLP